MYLFIFLNEISLLLIYVNFFIKLKIFEFEKNGLKKKFDKKI